MQITIQSSAPAVLPFGTLTIGPITVNGSIGPQAFYLNLASGFNSITVPSGSVGVIISPPTTNAIALLIKGVTGDTGLSLPPASPSIFLFGTAPATFGITAASSTTGNTQITFF